MAKAGIILSGCGVRDGSEIHETVCTLLALAKYAIEPVFFAPNIPQAEVINHVENVVLAGEVRNVLLESARIARGNITDLANASADQLVAVIFPGGSGVIKNLSTFAAEGANCRVNAHVERIILDMHEAGKPIGALCIAPVLVAKVFGSRGIKVTVTIGNDRATASILEQMGARHVTCPADQCAVDAEHKVVTCPCYMLAKSAEEVYRGVKQLAAEVLKLT